MKPNSAAPSSPPFLLLTPLVVLSLVGSGCFAAMTGIGTLAVVDGTTSSRAEQIGDAELSADVQRLAGKKLRPGTGEYYAGLCLQGYVNGRHAEASMAHAGELEKSALQNQLTGGYGTCQSHCMTAATQMRSEYSDIAEKYHPLCVSGMSAQQTRWAMAGLTNSIDAFKAASEPLALFFGERDSRLALSLAQKDNLDNPELPAYADEIETLSNEHGQAIAKGRAFFESLAAQKNFSKRETVQAEMEVLVSDIEMLRKAQDEVQKDGSLDGHMRAREYDDQIRAKQRLLGAKEQELALLKEEYRRMAIDKGVVRG